MFKIEGNVYRLFKTSDCLEIHLEVNKNIIQVESEDGKSVDEFFVISNGKESKLLSIFKEEQLKYIKIEIKKENDKGEKYKEIIMQSLGKELIIFLKNLEGNTQTDDSTKKEIEPKEDSGQDEAQIKNKHSINVLQFSSAQIIKIGITRNL